MGNKLSNIKFQVINSPEQGEMIGLITFKCPYCNKYNRYDRWYPWLICAGCKKKYVSNAEGAK